MLTCFLKNSGHPGYEEAWSRALFNEAPQTLALGYRVCLNSEVEERFLPSEENIKEYMCLHACNILIVHGLFFKLLKECKE